MTLPFRNCPQCGQPAVIAFTWCRRCGYQYTPDDAVPVTLPDPLPFDKSWDGPERGWAASLMWSLTVVAAIAAVYAWPRYMWVPVTIDIGAVALALWVWHSPSETDRMQGAVKLGLEAMGVLVVILAFLRYRQTP